MQVRLARFASLDGKYLHPGISMAQIGCRRIEHERGLDPTMDPRGTQFGGSTSFRQGHFRVLGSLVRFAWMVFDDILGTGGILIMAVRLVTLGNKGRLTTREVAVLSGASVPTVKKALQQNKLKARRLKSGTVMEPRAVPAMAAFRRLDARLSQAAQRRVCDGLFAEGSELPTQIEISDALVLRVTDEIRAAYERALAYVEARDRYLERRADVLGGTPVIKGTRLSVYALAARADAGDAISDLADDYPEVSVAAIRAAIDYAHAHPQVGRPRKPWREASPAA